MVAFRCSFEAAIELAAVRSEYWSIGAAYDTAQHITIGDSYGRSHQSTIVQSVHRAKITADGPSELQTIACAERGAFT